MPIVSMPPEAGPAMRFAAGELVKYLGQMTSQTWESKQEAKPTDGAAIRLDYAPQLGEDGFHLYRKGQAVCIAGGGSRGAMYGAYELLRQLGCRWPLPGKDYEVVPELEGFDWQGPELVSQPAMRRRGMAFILWQWQPQVVDWVDYLAKNGFNFLFYMGMWQAPFTEAINQRELGFEYGQHILRNLLPADLFEAHPEYFRFDGEKRNPDWNLCTSSDEALSVMGGNAQQMLTNLGGFVRLETLHTWGDDLVGEGWCKCPECAGFSETDQTVQMLNGIAAHTDLGATKLGFCAYHASIHAAEKVQADDSVRLMYAPRERCYLHPLGGCEANRRYLDYLKALTKTVPAEPEVFEYYNDCILLRHMGMPLYPTIGKDVEVYMTEGMDGVMSLFFQDFSDWAYGINTYTLGKALWRGKGEDGDAVEFCEAVYGPAAPAMKAFFDRLFELTATSMATCGYYDFVDLRFPPRDPWSAKHLALLAPLTTPAKLGEMDSLLKKAVRLAGEGQWGQNVEDQALLWEFTRHEVLTIQQELEFDPLWAKVLDKSATPEEARQLADALEDNLRRLDAGTEILMSAPERLRSPAGRQASFGERDGFFQGHRRNVRDLARGQQ